MENLPVMPPKVFTTSAILVGYLLIGNLNSLEQNALGNWLMAAGQVLVTNSTYQQVIESYKLRNDFPEPNLAEMLEKLINIIQQEIENSKNI